MKQRKPARVSEPSTESRRQIATSGMRTQSPICGLDAIEGRSPAARPGPSRNWRASHVGAAASMSTACPTPRSSCDTPVLVLLGSRGQLPFQQEKLFQDDLGDNNPDSYRCRGSCPIEGSPVRAEFVELTRGASKLPLGPRARWGHARA